MPELPEVETVRQGLNQMTLAQPIIGGDVLLDRTIAPPISVTDFLANLTGVQITQWHRRGKYLLAELQTTHNSDTPMAAPFLSSSRPPLEGGGQRNKSFTLTGGINDRTPARAAGWLGVHLRMTGQLLWVEPEATLQKHTRVRLFFGGDSPDLGKKAVRELRFVDQRTFGRMWWVPPDTNVEAIVTGLQNLGPEPFASEFSVDYLAKKMAGKRRAVKTALLDQAIVAGIGNIYADEALFVAGIAPQTVCATLTKEQIEQLHQSIIQVLETAIASGGTTFSDFLNVQGVNGNYGGVAWVYNRSGEPCRICATPIQRLKLGGRSSHFCPQCQRDA
jgi:formamidopyrimidine-DNA glycosylase